jgi:DNA-binding IclR family transcriptional regulator
MTESEVRAAGRAGDGPRLPLERMLHLLAVLGQAPRPLSLSELGRRSGLPKTTTHRMLGILRRERMVDRTGNAYYLGGRMFELAGSGLPGRPALDRRQFLPDLLELYERTRRTVSLGVLDGAEVAYIERLYGRDRVSSPSDLADRAPPHCTAIGKVLLAYRCDMVPGELPRLTPRTITTPGRLEAELVLAREHGIARSRGEFAPHICCLAAPVIGRGGRVVAAVGITAPPDEIEDNLVEGHLRRAAYALSMALRLPASPGERWPVEWRREPRPGKVRSC